MPVGLSFFADPTAANWALPGGTLELDESITECAVRGVREETGLDVEVTGLVGIYTGPRHSTQLTGSQS